LLTRHDSFLPRFLAEGAARLGDRTGFVTELLKYKDELIALPEDEGQVTTNHELLGHILDKILLVTIPQVLTGPRWSFSSAVISLLSICVPGNKMKTYGELLDAIARSRSDEPFYTRYNDFHAEIIPKLIKLLGGTGSTSRLPLPGNSPAVLLGLNIVGT
jgi:hypothetical protein